MKCVSKHQYLQIFVLNLKQYEYFSAISSTATHNFKWLKIYLTCQYWKKLHVVVRNPKKLFTVECYAEPICNKFKLAPF